MQDNAREIGSPFLPQSIRFFSWYAPPMRGRVFGQSPWGRYFIDAMETIADQGRLQRGRSYASHGDVLALETEGTEVRAKVAGNYRPFYDVAISFRPMPAEDARFIRAWLAERPMQLARIRSGELPEEFLAALEDAEIRLLPRAWKEMRRSCTCPDSGDPCKHEAAVYYILAQEIDRDPGKLFSLRGIELDGGDRALGTGSARAAAAPASDNKGATRGGASGKSAERSRKKADGASSVVAIPDPFGARMVKAWSASQESRSNFPEPPSLQSFASAIPAFLKRLPPLEGVDLPVTLTAFYHEATARWPVVLSPRALPGAEARAFASGPVEVRLMPAGAVMKTARHGEESPLAFMRRCLSLESEAMSREMRYLAALARFCRSLIANAAFYPDIIPSPRGFRAVWLPALFAREVDAYLTSLGPFAVPPRPDAEGRIPDRASSTRMIASAFLGDAVRALRFSAKKVSESDSPVFRALFSGEEIDCRSPSYRSLPSALDARFAVFDLARAKRSYEIKVAKAPPSKAKSDGLAYKLSARVKGRDGAFASLAAAVASEGAEVLAFPAMLSSIVPALGRLGDRNGVILSREELETLVTENAALLERIGVEIVLPKELSRIARPRRVLVGKTASHTRNLASYLDVHAIATFEWKIDLGGRLVDAAEFEALLREGRRLVRVKDAYVRLDPREAALILARVRDGGETSPLEAIEAGLAGEAEFSPELRAAFEALIAGGARGEAAEIPDGLRATLRPYQERGFKWIMANLAQGFGAVLADDMGLGKTVQAIAAIVALKERKELAKGALVAVPAGLIANWERELGVFAPGLRVAVYYGPRRAQALKAEKGPDVVLSSYETLSRDAKRLEGRAWDVLVVDEAHQLKNPEAKKTLAMKAVKSARRLALSGTPVENKLSELWSIFDFAIPGYLGSLRDFAARYRGPIEVDRSKEAAERLRRVTSPFLLRRLKTDKAVIADLPDKIVIDEYAELSPEQAALYRAVAEKTLKAFENADKEARGAMILDLLTALKQIGNHPANFDKTSPPETELSGKSRLLLSILDEALECGEKVLVFSQYVEMLGILEAIVKRDLGVDPFVLHGSLSKEKRAKAVDAFQAAEGPGIFLVSLKAGGVGLNLTAATRVIHYDLWFNPAVENQATDRAFRIGQTKNVFVHRLITRGTLEERIDAIIKGKRELQELAVGTGETWLKDITADRLKDLVRLEA